MGNYCCKKASTTNDRDLEDYSSQRPSGGSLMDTRNNAMIQTNNVENAPDPMISSSRLRALTFKLSFSRNTFTREQLERATNGFSDSNFLGKGGFGSVHKGVLEDGRQVAIKQLILGGAQGDREFQAEVEIISRLHHRYLVSLVGWCIAEGERMLVYEFVPNNTLKFHLHGNGQPTMDWPTRVQIALGSAKGLAYLHEDCHPKIIHRDIKTDNILLDDNFEAKIADFGLATIFPDDQTHVELTRIAGTIGYLDPEYASCGELTDKSDVYAFGVILLELITGFQPLSRRIGSTRSTKLVAWVWPYLEARDYNGLVDPRLQRKYNAEELTRIVECAAACVQLSSQSRPRMSQVVRVLEGKEVVERTPSQDYSNGHSDANTVPQSPALHPLMPQNGTTEYPDSSSDYLSIINSNQDQNNIQPRSQGQ